MGSRRPPEVPGKRDLGPQRHTRDTAMPAAITPEWGVLGRMPAYEGGGLGPPGQVELAEQRADVGLDRMLAQEERSRDLPVRFPLRDQRKDAPLLLGEV